MLNKNQINNNIQWLINNGSSAVKLLTYHNILKDGSRVSSDLFSDIQKSDLVKDIMAKQSEDGSWCASGQWAIKATMRKSGYTPVSPKYVTTAWILPLLGDSGCTINMDSVRKACDYILSFQQSNGYIGETRMVGSADRTEDYGVEPCRFSLILIALAKIKALGDKRVKKSFDLLQSWQQDDGGWVSEHHSSQKKWNRSCPFATYHSAYAFYCSEFHGYDSTLKKALTFLIDHLSQKGESEIQRFFYHGHSIIHELLMFSEFNIGLDTKTVHGLLNWLLSMYDEKKSCFRYNGKPVSRFTLKDDYMDSKVAKYRLFQLIEDDWLTYYATRIFKNIWENHNENKS